MTRPGSGRGVLAVVGLALVALSLPWWLALAAGSCAWVWPGSGAGTGNGEKDIARPRTVRASTTFLGRDTSRSETAHLHGRKTP